MTTRNDVDDAIREYREASRTEWLLAAWAVAGGAIGSAIVLFWANGMVLATLLN